MWLVRLEAGLMQVSQSTHRSQMDCSDRQLGVHSTDHSSLPRVDKAMYLQLSSLTINQLPIRCKGSCFRLR